MSAEHPPPVWWVRFKEGVVGRTKRVTHAVPVPEGFHTHAVLVPDYGIPEVLTSYCGQIFRQGEAEAVPPLTGQPCNGCLLTLPLPPEPLQLSGTELHDDG